MLILQIVTEVAFIIQEAAGKAQANLVVNCATSGCDSYGRQAGTHIIGLRFRRFAAARGIGDAAAADQRAARRASANLSQNINRSGMPEIITMR